MSKEIDTETLRRWMDEHRPLTLLDIRSAEDRALWSIPGSLHADVEAALREGQPGELATVLIPADRPVVTICGRGRASQTVADMLVARGFDAQSLSGGMKAWSLAWNTADVPMRDAALRVVQVRRTGKGCLSYIVGNAGEAAVIDPSVSPEVYVHLAKTHGWSIRYVLETHIHADHLSRARRLAEETGAGLLLPPQGRVKFSFVPLGDGDHVRLGTARITARHTPGHTGESTCYMLDSAAVFTGDTLFIDGVGRPDLHADPEEAQRRSRALFASLMRVRQWEPSLMVLPAHTSEPIAFDGRAIAAPLHDVMTRLSGWLTLESSFVERVTSKLPPAPENFARIVELNEAGQFPSGDPTDLESGANRCAVR